MEDRIENILYKTTQSISELSKNLAVLATERKHLTKEVLDVCGSVSELRSIVAVHDESIGVLSKKDKDREERTKMIKETWYKVFMVIIVVGGILAAEYEIIKQPQDKTISMKIQPKEQNTQQKS